MSPTTCAGWEKLPHDVEEVDIMVIGSTRFCKDCYQKFQQDPLKDELTKYL